jgi:isopentenyl-diphosphate delta-isomerase type 1
MELPMERFATFDRAGNPLGLVPRAEVHRDGHWHKSAQVFLFDQAERLLLQKRAPDKDLYADLWDYSVGEHLQPGESYEQAALRGLDEELGIRQAQLVRLGGVRFVELAGEDFCDREIQQAFRATCQGAIRFDPVEVSEVRFLERSALAAWTAREPAAFTPWFLCDLREFGFLP